jgi:hypothetical protein
VVPPVAVRVGALPAAERLGEAVRRVAGLGQFGVQGGDLVGQAGEEDAYLLGA